MLLTRLAVMAGVGLATLAMACTAAGAPQPRVDTAVPRQLSAQTRSFVMIEGDNFRPNAQARLGDNMLDSITWVNARVLTGVVPAGMPAGRYGLTVINPGGNQMTLTAAITLDGTNQAPAAAPASSGAPPPPTRSAPSRTPSPVPTPSPTPARATPGETTPAPRTPAPPATASPAGAPVRPQPARTAQSQIRSQSISDVSGQWIVYDNVSYGPGSGNIYPFRITLQQQGNQVTGGGDGLSLSGSIQGDTIKANYMQDNGTSGTFQWALNGDESAFSGTFSNSAGNGGTSSGQRGA